MVTNSLVNHSQFWLEFLSLVPLSACKMLHLLYYHGFNPEMLKCLKDFWLGPGLSTFRFKWMRGVAKWFILGISVRNSNCRSCWIGFAVFYLNWSFGKSYYFYFLTNRLENCPKTPFCLDCILSFHWSRLWSRLWSRVDFTGVDYPSLLSLLKWITNVILIFEVNLGEHVISIFFPVKVIVKAWLHSLVSSWQHCPLLIHLNFFHVK